MYRIVFSSRAGKSITRIPKKYQIKIKNKIEELSKNPNAPGTVRLVDYPVAQFRNRVGNYRILFDKDDSRKVIEILDIRKRDKSTYK